GIGIEGIEAVMLRRHIQHVGHPGLTAGGRDLLLGYVEWLSVDLAVHLVLKQETEGGRAHVARIQDRLGGVQSGPRGGSAIGKHIGCRSGRVDSCGGKKETKDKL